MGETQTGLYIFFVVLDYRSFSSKTGEFVSLLETANASSIQKRFNIPASNFNSSLHYENQYHLYIKLEEEEAKDQGLVKIPDTDKLYRFTTTCKEEAINKYKIHSHHKIVYYDKIGEHGEDHYIESSSNVVDEEVNN